MNKLLFILILPIILFSTIGISHITTYNNNSQIVNNAPQSFVYYNQIYEPLNTTVYLNATISGGTPPYIMQWYLNNSAITGANSPNLVYTLSYRTNYTFYLNIIDSAGVSINSKFYNYTTNPFLIISVNKNYNPLNANIPVNITYNILAGSAPFNITWNVNGKLSYSNSLSGYNVNNFSAYGFNYVHLEIKDEFQTEYYNYTFFAHNISFEIANGIVNYFKLSINGQVITVYGNSIKLNVFGNITWSVLNTNNINIIGNTSGYFSTQTNNVVILLNIAEINNNFMNFLPFVIIIIAFAGFLIIIANYRRKQ